MSWATPIHEYFSLGGILSVPLTVSSGKRDQVYPRGHRSLRLLPDLSAWIPPWQLFLSLLPF